MSAPLPPYLLITPCRDEAAYARRTLDSVVAQTHRPACWLIVDDGSSDATPQLLAEYAAKHPWIRVLRRENRGHRSVGPGVIDAFYAGWEVAEPERYPYFAKFDLDLDIPPRYFEILLQRMEAEPRLATCSGKPWFRGPNGERISEGCGDEMSVGMTKLYRRAAFEQIGGFVREVMWDGIDCHRARQLGWRAESYGDEELAFEHLRPMGSSQKSIYTGRVRHGAGQHFMGTGFLYMSASAVFRMLHPPYILGGLAMEWGWLKSFFARKPRYADPAFRKFLRRYQLACLVQGKRRATRALDARQASVWRPPQENAS
ncbi:MAG: glycosyltransferase family 2 protein [Planctomycetes bacterium]|nr:glycosyltransferase family 2 protein [Planctomycetota bacterium]